MHHRFGLAVIAARVMPGEVGGIGAFVGGWCALLHGVVPMMMSVLLGVCDGYGAVGDVGWG